MVDGDRSVGPEELRAGNAWTALRREDRLRKKKDFSRVMEEGRFYRHPLLTLAVLQHGGTERRMGLSVGKKVGQSVLRNRTKRRLRELYRVRQQRLVPGVDLIFFARTAAAEAGFQEMGEAMDQLLHRAKLWQKAEPPDKKSHEGHAAR